MDLYGGLCQESRKLVDSIVAWMFVTCRVLLLHKPVPILLMLHVLLCQSLPLSGSTAFSLLLNGKLQSVEAKN